MARNTRNTRNNPPESSTDRERETGTTVTPAPRACAVCGTAIRFDAGFGWAHYGLMPPTTRPHKAEQDRETGAAGPSGRVSDTELARRLALMQSAIASDPTLGGLLTDPIVTPDGVSGTIPERLESLRAAIEAESISYGEIAELQDLAEHIDPSDVLLLEWAGVPEPLDERATFFAERRGEYIAADLLAEIRDVTDLPVIVEQTGGNVATIYIGGPYADGAHLLAMGPGRFDWSDPSLSIFYRDDLSIGPDTDDMTDAIEIDGDLLKIGPAVLTLLHESQHAETGTYVAGCPTCDAESFR